MRALTGTSPIADEIISLQLLDHYEASQRLLDQARLDIEDHGGAWQVPAIAFAQLWHDYTSGCSTRRKQMP